jgi:uncharacterized protein (UPF0305 family)
MQQAKQETYDFMQSKLNRRREDTFYNIREMITISTISAIISGVIGLMLGGLTSW